MHDGRNYTPGSARIKVDRVRSSQCRMVSASVGYCTRIYAEARQRPTHMAVHPLAPSTSTSFPPRARICHLHGPLAGPGPLTGPFPQSLPPGEGALRQGRLAYVRGATARARPPDRSPALRAPSKHYGSRPRRQALSPWTTWLARRCRFGWAVCIADAACRADLTTSRRIWHKQVSHERGRPRRAPPACAPSGFALLRGSRTGRLGPGMPLG